LLYPLKGGHGRAEVAIIRQQDRHGAFDVHTVCMPLAGALRQC
jgi:hypothetical protein